MYTLRRVKDNGVEMNWSLGDFYILNQKCLVDEKEFKEELEKHQIPFEDVFGIVFTSNPSRPPIPLYLKDSYYIMTEGGKTLSKLSK